LQVLRFEGRNEESEENSILCNYSSQFHPTSTLKNGILKILKKIEQISDPKFWPETKVFEYNKTGKTSNESF
jgi:hypothetical protein